MARRGPNPNPRSERTRTGRNTFNKVAGMIEPPAPLEPPMWLSPEARELWDQHCEWLKKQGWLTPTTAYPFAALCATYGQARQMDAQITAKGLMIKGPRGRLSPHPLLRPVKGMWQAFMTGARDFGMTPASRQRMPKPPEKPSDDDRRFFGTGKTKKYFDD